MRRDRLDQFEKARIFALRPMMWSKPGKPPQLPPQVAGLFFERLIFLDAPHGPAQFIQQTVVLDHVAVGAEIHGVNGGIHRRNAGDQDENRGGRNFLRILQQLDAVHVRHADIGNHDVEDLRSQPPLGSLPVGSHFHFVAFLAKADFQQLADGAFVVDD